MDSTSLEVFRPKGRYEEVKSYYDVKNGMYALKKEVAVMASPPHFISPCLFPKVCFLGSKHDYQFFKENYSVYLDYLRKEVAERKQLLNDEPAFWGVCQDKGSTGPAEDTPEIGRVIDTQEKWQA